MEAWVKREWWLKLVVVHGHPCDCVPAFAVCLKSFLLQGMGGGILCAVQCGVSGLLCTGSSYGPEPRPRQSVGSRVLPWAVVSLSVP